MRTHVRFAALFSLAPLALLAQTNPVVNGYFTEWGIYSSPTPFFVKNLILNGDVHRLTQISYAFASISSSGTCQLDDAWADVQRPFTHNESVNGQDDSTASNALHGSFNQLKELKKLYPHVRVVMSIGGASENPQLFSQVSATDTARKTFVSSCISMFIQGNFGNGVAATPGIFDGFDIDWEYPTASDTDNLVKLLTEFRNELNAVQPNLLLTMASSAGQYYLQFIDLKRTSVPLDFFNVMTYDYAGPWQNTSGFVAPLYQTQYDPDPTLNVDWTITDYLNAGVPASKIVMGIPFYGYGWNTVSNTQNGQFVSGTPVDQGDSYAYITGLMPTFQEFRAQPGNTPFLYNGSQFWTYDDAVSIHEKMKYLRQHNLRGAMAWELSQDLPDGHLLQIVSAGVRE